MLSLNLFDINTKPKTIYLLYADLSKLMCITNLKNWDYVAFFKFNFHEPFVTRALTGHEACSIKHCHRAIPDIPWTILLKVNFAFSCLD